MLRGGCRVLVVDDDRSTRELLACVLEEEGHDVRAASGGREALAMAHDWRPDLIMLDLVMPDLDGWSFRAEQRMSQIADIPVLVLTAVSYPEIHADSLVAPIISKPFDLNHLLDVVQELLAPAQDAVRTASTATEPPQTGVLPSFVFKSDDRPPLNYPQVGVDQTPFEPEYEEQPLAERQWDRAVAAPALR
jgi:DNA-binding response OmpR family regulator